MAHGILQVNVDFLRILEICVIFFIENIKNYLKRLLVMKKLILGFML